MIRREIRVFLTAVMYFTRIPVPSWTGHSEEQLSASARYFPLVGALVGAVCAAVFALSALVFTRETSVVLAIASGVLLTGAFHEDGFADFCDGFGGGWRKEHILEIMRDSRIGAFGTIGIVLLFLAKYHLYLEAGTQRIPWLFVASHSFSRFAPCLVSALIPYARDDANPKPVAKGIHKRDLALAFLFAIAPLFWVQRWSVVAAVAAVLLAALLFAWYVRKWIGGYTGDCLGALQQISELVFIGVLAAVWMYF